MAFKTFVQDTYIAATPEVVHSFLAEMNNRALTHPLITQIQHTGTTATPDGTPVKAYLIRDRMKLGPFTIHFTYRASMSISTNGEIISDAYQSPGIHLHNIITCQAEGNGSRLEERNEITAPRLLMKTTYKAALSSHIVMIENLKKIAEAGQQATNAGTNSYERIE